MRIEAKKDWEEAKRFNVLQLRLMKKCVDQIKKKTDNCLLEENEIQENKTKFFLQFVLSCVDTAATIS